MRILVTAATGTVGRIVVDRLLAAGRTVRALTRNPDRAGLPGAAEVVAGDLTDADAVERVLEGVDHAYLVPGVVDLDASRLFADRAARAGVRRIVTLTSSAVTVRRPGNHETLHRAEQAVEAAVPEWTHVRPGEFAVNRLDFWGPSIRAENVVRNAFPDALGVPIHEADIAEVAVAALVEDGHAGRTYTLSGPEALSHRRQAAAIGDGLGREIRFEALTYGQARRAYIEAGLPMEIAEYVLSYQAEYAEEPPEVSPDVERVLGRPGRTLARWAADHAADLG
ncbi:NAD(P)H-binding protein [Streptosporangium sp. NPDC050855]|uniref:NAD(P)H-binding protein n=1 Tax=Streptosporangium sp. NPDC050855 TaxID=3366194 RepID=UPI003791BDB9